MNQSSYQLLKKLLDAWQANPDRSRSVRLPITQSRAPQYFEASLPEVKEALHAGLLEAASAGTVALEWGRGYESHILKRITLTDGPGLADYLVVPLAAKQADTARIILENELSGQEPWVREWVQELLDHWSRNKLFFGLSPDELEIARLLVRAFESVSAGRQRNLDLRTFSVRELGNSKAMEDILSRFLTIWKKYHSTDLSSSELCATLDLIKFPSALLLRGPIILDLGGRHLECDGIRPYVGIPSQAIKKIVLDRMPDYVLFIENLVSFNRHVVEVQDNGLIIYTGGFPSLGVFDFLRMLDITLPPDLPFYHWGDIDEGGLKIFMYIQGGMTRNLKLHLMTAGLLALHGQPKPSLRVEEVQRVAGMDPNISLLAAAILSTDPPKVLEQENTDPLSPCEFIVKPD